jgi:hypothetical protein
MGMATVVGVTAVVALCLPIADLAQARFERHQIETA